MDGEITIGTNLSTDKFDKQIASLEKKMKKAEDKKISLEADITVKTEDLKKQREEVKALERDLKRVQEIGSSKYPGTQMMDYRRIATKYGKDTSISYADMSSILKQRIEEATSKEDTLAMKLDEIKDKHYAINQEVEEYKQKIEGVELQQQVAQADELKKSYEEIGNSVKEGFKGFGNSIQDSINKVARLALGIFGIRSAYMALRRASSDLASYDQQYATNLEYIRFALTQSIAPVLRYIVSLAATLLSYIYAILNTWFGIGQKVDISAKAFQRMKGSAGGAVKAVKELKKQLAGFDEITMLNDQADGGTSGGVGGVGMPSFDLSALSGKIPEWLQWILDHKQEVLEILAAVAAGLLAWKLGLNAIASIGIGVAVYGVIQAVKALIKWIKDPTWKNFSKFLDGLATAIIGVGIAMVAMNASNPTGWIVILIGTIVLLIRTIGDLIDANITNKAKILSVKEAEEQLKEAQDRLRDSTNQYVKAVEDSEQAHQELIDAEKRNKMSGEELYKLVEQGTLDYKDMNSAQREVYNAYLKNKHAEEDLTTATQNLKDATKEETKASIENELALAYESGEYEKLKKAVVDAYNQGKLSAGEARDYIERAMGQMNQTAQREFSQNIPGAIKDGLNPDKYTNVFQRFKNRWNSFWGGLIKNINLDLKANMGSFGGGQGGGGMRAKGGIFYPSMLPKLAVGGIINQPGSGVPYHGAIIGERGAEAVVPLTDTQQMELLGSTIGRYVNLNATIPVYVGNRQIAREIKHINAEQDFAFNV